MCSVMQMHSGVGVPVMEREQAHQKTGRRGRKEKGEGGDPAKMKGRTQTEAARADAAQDGQVRTLQTNPEYGWSRSSLDQPLKEAIEGDTLSFGGSRFHTLGAMDFIDLLSEWLTKRLLLAPRVLCV